VDGTVVPTVVERGEEVPVSITIIEAAMTLAGVEEDGTGVSVTIDPDRITGVLPVLVLVLVLVTIVIDPDRITDLVLVLVLVLVLEGGGIDNRNNINNIAMGEMTPTKKRLTDRKELERDRRPTITTDRHTATTATTDDDPTTITTTTTTTKPPKVSHSPRPECHPTAQSHPHRPDSAI